MPSPVRSRRKRAVRIAREEVEAAGHIDNRDAHAHGLSAHRPRHADEAASGLQEAVEGGASRVFPGLAEAGHGSVYEPGIFRLQDIPAHAQPIHYAGEEVFHQNIRPATKLPEHIHSLGIFEVQRDGALAAIQAHKIAALAVFERADGAAVLPPGALHLDDFRAIAREIERYDGAGIELAGVDNFQTLEE